MRTNDQTLSSQMRTLQKTDLSTMIRMAGAMAPRLIKGFLPKLDEKQRKAFDEVMPVEGQKKIFINLTDSPTPPIVVGMAHPLKIFTSTEKKIEEKKIKGLRLSTHDLQVLTGGLTLGNMLKFLWRLKGQIFTLFSIGTMFMPFLRLGTASLKDLQNKAKTHFKPLFNLLPH